MNRVYPNLIIVRQPNFSNATGSKPWDSLQKEIDNKSAELEKLYSDLEKSKENLAENKQTYYQCINGMLPSVQGSQSYLKNICDAQVLPNVTAEEKKISNLQTKISELEQDLYKKRAQLEGLLNAAAKTDPEAMAQLQQLQASSSAASSKKWAIFAIGGVVIAAIIGLVWYFIKKRNKA